MTPRGITWRHARGGACRQRARGAHLHTHTHTHTHTHMHMHIHIHTYAYALLLLDRALLLLDRAPASLPGSRLTPLRASRRSRPGPGVRPRPANRPPPQARPGRGKRPCWLRACSRGLPAPGPSARRLPRQAAGGGPGEPAAAQGARWGRRLVSPQRPVLVPWTLDTWPNGAFLDPFTPGHQTRFIGGTRPTKRHAENAFVSCTPPHSGDLRRPRHKYINVCIYTCTYTHIYRYIPMYVSQKHT